nr:leucine-rich repeat protein [Alistipes sp.]
MTINSAIVSKNYSSSNSPLRSSKFNSVVIGEDIIAIGNYAFYYCNSIKRVNLPSNLISIGDYAFAGCYNMEVYCAATTPPRIQSETFTSISVNGSYTYVYVPRASESLYKSEWRVCESALIVGYDF